MNTSRSRHELASENDRLKKKLAEAESVLRAIQRGEIDAVVVQGDDQERIYTLESADRPYRVLVESMSEGAATLSQDGMILYANPRLATLLEISGAALTSTRLVDWATPRDKASLDLMIHECRNGLVSGELTLTGSTGTVLPVRASFSPLPLEGQSFCCAIISDLRLAKHHEALEIAAQRIREANDRLREADQRKDAFLATLAHELRNPLAPIRSAANFLSALHDEDHSHAKASRIIERQVAHMTRLVDDLLEVSRITLGRLRLKQKREELTRIVASVAESLKDSPNQQRDLTVKLPDDEMFIHGDAVRLSQAISNVVDNALKYTPSSGRIEVSVCRDRGSGVITVEDNGVGFSADAAPRIFEMFTQEACSDGRSYGGLGIGLALARSIVELHGGTIEGSSPGPGLGSTFVIRVPLQAVATINARPIDESPADAPPQVILIVDDNIDAAESLSLLLELSGHTAKSVHTGTDALSAVEGLRPEFVLLDIGLPDIDGYEVARRLQSVHGDSCPTLVALSGWGRSEDKLRAAEAGIDEFMTKPVSVDSLLRLIAERAPPKHANA